MALSGNQITGFGVGAMVVTKPPPVTAKEEAAAYEDRHCIDLDDLVRLTSVRG